MADVYPSSSDSSVESGQRLCGREDLNSEAGGEAGSFGDEGRRSLSDPGGRRMCNAEMALGYLWGAILIVLWAVWLLGEEEKKNPWEEFPGNGN